MHTVIQQALGDIHLAAGRESEALLAYQSAQTESLALGGQLGLVDLKVSGLSLRDAEDSGLRRLSASKKSRNVRGPRDVEIWFDPNSGTILKLELYGLPQARGGPRAIRLSLTDQLDLGADFFSHAAHHEDGREIRTNLSK